MAHRCVNYARLAAIGCAQADLRRQSIKCRYIVAKLLGCPADVLAHRALETWARTRIARDAQHVLLVVATNDSPPRVGRARQHEAQALARARPTIDNIAGDDDGVGFPAINMLGHGLERSEVPVNVG